MPADKSRFTCDGYSHDREDSSSNRACSTRSALGALSLMCGGDKPLQDSYRLARGLLSPRPCSLTGDRDRFAAMERQYEHDQIEQSGSRSGRSSRRFVSPKTRRVQSFTVLKCFQPSGRIHMGRPRYAIGDVVARSNDAGMPCLHPMGWDAFGFRRRMLRLKKASLRMYGPRQHRVQAQSVERLGLSYDWSREITTCEPDTTKEPVAGSEL